MSDVIKIVDSENPGDVYEASLSDWTRIAEKIASKVRGGASLEIHVPPKVNPFEVVRELDFGVKQGDDADDLNVIIVQAERRWGPLIVEALDQAHVVFREIENQDGEGLEWIGEHDSPPHFLGSRVVAKFFSHAEGGAPISSDFSGGVVDIGHSWLEIRQSNYDFEYSISQVPDNQIDFLAGWIRKNHLESLFLVLEAVCKWTNQEFRELWDEARLTIELQGLASVNLFVEPAVVRGCIESLTADNPALRAVLRAIEGEYSPASELVLEALDTASESESVHPIFELESKIAQA